MHCLLRVTYAFKLITSAPHKLSYGAATAGGTFVGTAIGFSDFWAFDNPMVTMFEISAVTMDGATGKGFGSWELFVARANKPSGMIRDFKYSPSGSSALLVGTAECAPEAGVPCGSGGKI